MIQGVKLSEFVKALAVDLLDAGVLTDMKQDVDKIGVAVAMLPSGYACTVGMAKHGLPELVMYVGKFVKLLNLVHALSRKFIAERPEIKQGLMDVSNDAAELHVYMDLLEFGDVINQVPPTAAFYGLYPELVKDEISFVQVMWYDNSDRYPIHAEYDQVNFPQKMVNPARNVRVQ